MEVKTPWQYHKGLEVLAQETADVASKIEAETGKKYGEDFVIKTKVSYDGKHVEFIPYMITAALLNREPNKDHDVMKRPDYDDWGR